uniref:Geranyl diphosphate synthase small subunit type II.1 n=1 Tax=Salvia miltiorrhiza TaxID=226208 RepID=H6VLF5_SALMI|nr:geranyl diphosphate synthase small subunit type II.1 [Salvia miltiorrhiza]
MALSIAVTPSSNSRMPRTAVLRRAVRCSSAASVPTTQPDLRNYWTSLISDVDRKLNDAVPLKYPELIHESMRYSLLAKTAKRAPPVMCIAACELFGGDRAAAIPTVCALEMVHAASFVHDDLPYIDDALSRRGQLPNHTLYGPDMAILAGDALLPLAFQYIVLHTPTQLVSQLHLLRVVQEIARAVGSTGMAATQFIGENKFGELGRCSAVCGALLGGASDEEIERLGEYGRIVGILYRVVEDMLEGKKVNIGVVEDLKSRARKELYMFEKYGDKVLPLHTFIDYAAERV